MNRPCGPVLGSALQVPASPDGPFPNICHSEEHSDEESRKQNAEAPEYGILRFAQDDSKAKPFRSRSGAGKRSESRKNSNPALRRIP